MNGSASGDSLDFLVIPYVILSCDPVKANGYVYGSFVDALPYLVWRDKLSKRTATAAANETSNSPNRNQYAPSLSSYPFFKAYR